jgi:putative inorganic carbon (HCO3(-)) transporter
MGSPLGSAASWIARWEPVFVLLAAPPLLFPAQQPALTVAALGGLVVLWLVRWAVTGRAATRTPMDVSLLLLALMIPVVVWASPAPDLTLPKLTGLILGFAAFRATTSFVRSPSDLRLATGVFLLLGLGFVLVGGAGVYWPDKIPLLQPIVAHIPRLVHDLPGTEYGVHPNELGGTILFFLPTTLSLAFAQMRQESWGSRAARMGALFLCLLFLTVLLLSQSRSAWMGAAAGLATVAMLRWRRARWLVLSVTLVVIAAVLVTRPEPSQETAQPGLDRRMVLDLGSLGERSGPWGRALDMIEQYPLTGSGLGAFRRIAHLFGPVPLAAPDPDMSHAHNVFLQVAVDVGIPGLVAYVALLGTALWCAGQVVRQGEARLSGLAIGIIGSLVAFHVYGLADTIALGAKPGLAFWLLLALACAAWRVAREGGSAARAPAVSSQAEST